MAGNVKRNRNEDSGKKTIRILAAVMGMLAVVYFLPAFMQRTDTISGHTREAVYRSAVKVKKYLATDDRLTFDTAFGLLDQIKTKEGPDVFMKTVDGLKAEEVISLARDEVNARIAAGDPEFKAYTSWDEMIAKLMAESSQSSGRKRNVLPAALRSSDREGRPQ